MRGALFKVLWSNMLLIIMTVAGFYAAVDANSISAKDVAAEAARAATSGSDHELGDKVDASGMRTSSSLSPSLVVFRVVRALRALFWYVTKTVWPGTISIRYFHRPEEAKVRWITLH